MAGVSAGRSLERILMPLLLGLGAVALTAGPVSAVDYGNWQACQVIGLYNHEPAARGGLCMASTMRDSSYAGDYYGNLAPGHPMNDQVQTFDNGFTTINLRSFRNANYTNTGGSNTSCFGHGFGYGPYTTGNSQGLSSFKRC
jgi:hypothetical protein